jgi:predicted amino acid dehydrogenase
LAFKQLPIDGKIIRSKELKFLCEYGNEKSTMLKNAAYKIESITCYRCFKNVLLTFIYHYSPFRIKRKKIDFIFLVHPRYMEDYEMVFPTLSIIKRFIPEKWLIKFIEKFPPIIVDKIRAEDGMKGVMISTLVMPQNLMSDRKRLKKEIKRVQHLVLKAFKPRHKKIVLGTGAWWPMLTQRGKMLRQYFDESKFTLTSGHTATVFSIVKSVDQLIKKSKTKPKNAMLAILGCGDIGSAVAESLVSMSYNVTLIDLFPKKLEILKAKLLKINDKAIIKTYISEPNGIKSVLSTCHMGVCATANIELIIDRHNIPENFIFLDDSKPEAIPRFSVNNSRYTLEGGLLKIKGMKAFHNLGFGTSDNMLGCLSECYIVAKDHQLSTDNKSLIGKVSADDILWMKDSCEKNDIKIGDYKSGNDFVGSEKLVNALNKRSKSILIR